VTTTNPASAEAASTPALSILVPVFNEQATIRPVVEKVRSIQFGASMEIVIVDDGSSDGTSDILDALPGWPDVKVVRHARNGGKGAAIQTALQHARGRFVVIQDADLELNPEDIIPLFEVVREGQAAVCYGSRFMGECRQYRRLPTYWANRVLTLVCNLLNGIHLTDMNTCYKMMRADVARRIDLQSRGFAMEPEITTKLARLGVKIIERPIAYKPRRSDQGKKIKAFDLVRYLITMVRFRCLPTAPPAVNVEQAATLVVTGQELPDSPVYSVQSALA